MGEPVFWSQTGQGLGAAALLTSCLTRASSPVASLYLSVFASGNGFIIILSTKCCCVKPLEQCLANSKCSVNGTHRY